MPPLSKLFSGGEWDGRPSQGSRQLDGTSADADGTSGRPLRADARRNYELLLEAARKVFAAEGGGAALETIAKEAGVGVGTLYRRFPQRIDLVEAVYRDDVDTLVGLAERSATELDPWTALERWLWGYVEYGRAKRTFLSELHEAFEKNPNLKPASRDRIFAACDTVLRRAQQAGVARSDVDGADVMQLISPMCMNSTLSAEQSGRLLAMVLDGLRATHS